MMTTSTSQHDTRTILQKINAFIEQHGFAKRNGHIFVSNEGYLTPGYSLLNARQRNCIGKNFCIKKITNIHCDDIAVYKKLFDYGPVGEGKTWRNTNHLHNILESLYDLSIRYYYSLNESDLSTLFQNFLAAYFKHLKYKITIAVSSELLENINCFFNFPTNFLPTASRALVQATARNTLSPEERSILREFIDFTPDPEQVSTLMEEFYREYEQKITGDYIHTAAWIIFRIGQIHPLEDGNGRLARTLAFELIQSHTQLTFTHEEIVAFGKSLPYTDATSWGGSLTRIKCWLVSVIESKMQPQLPRGSAVGSHSITFFESQREDNTPVSTPPQAAGNVI